MEAIEQLQALPCGVCGGKGWMRRIKSMIESSIEERCLNCDGTGLEFPWLTRECPKCNGLGAVGQHLNLQEATGPCWECRGSGRVSKSESEQLWALLNYLVKQPVFQLDPVSLIDALISVGSAQEFLQAIANAIHKGLKDAD